MTRERASLGQTNTHQPEESQVSGLLFCAHRRSCLDQSQGRTRRPSMWSWWLGFLVVVALETGGRWSGEVVDFIDMMAGGRARVSQRRSVHMAWATSVDAHVECVLCPGFTARRPTGLTCWRRPEVLTRVRRVIGSQQSVRRVSFLSRKKKKEEEKTKQTKKLKQYNFLPKHVVCFCWVSAMSCGRGSLLGRRRVILRFEGFPGLPDV